MFNILVAEDDKSLNKLISNVLTQNGYNTYPVFNGMQALEVMDSAHIDMLITDIMMNEMDGYELTDTLRAGNSAMPVLMITAKDSFKDKKQGFLVGTDDYMVKPIDLNEMLLRVGALLRRSKIVNEQKLNVGNVELDYQKLSVTENDKFFTLPPKEFYLLYKLLSYTDVIFTRLQLMDEIWGMDSEADDRTVDVHIKRLRERFDSNDNFEIVTVRGLGYKAVKKA